MRRVFCPRTSSRRCEPPADFQMAAAILFTAFFAFRSARAQFFELSVLRFSALRENANQLFYILHVVVHRRRNTDSILVH